jgi:hypothetical protein
MPSGPIVAVGDDIGNGIGRAFAGKADARVVHERGTANCENDRCQNDRVSLGNCDRDPRAQPSARTGSTVYDLTGLSCSRCAFSSSSVAQPVK